MCVAQGGISEKTHAQIHWIWKRWWQLSPQHPPGCTAALVKHFCELCFANPFNWFDHSLLQIISLRLTNLLFPRLSHHVSHNAFLHLGTYLVWFDSILRYTTKLKMFYYTNCNNRQRRKWQFFICLRSSFRIGPGLGDTCTVSEHYYKHEGENQNCAFKFITTSLQVLP